MNKKFSEYLISKGNIKASTRFIPSDELNYSLPISTPFTFPFIGNEVVLAKDKMGWWNPLGGHIEDNESWQQALIRESEEEGGVVVKNIRVIGYVKVVKLKEHLDNKYPEITQIPITISDVDKIDEYWLPKETFYRKVFTIGEAIEVLKTREDNNQMLEIFIYLLKKRIKISPKP